MTRRLCLLLACALAPIALVTGCGGSSPSKSIGASGATINAARQNQAHSLADCRQAAANPGLPQNEKTILQSECVDIQTGNATALKAAGEQLCRVEAALLPTGERATMLASCKAQVK